MDFRFPTLANPNQRRWLTLGVVSVAMVFCVMFFRDESAWKGLIEHEAELRAFAKANLLSTMLCCVLLYAVITGLSIPVATLMTLVFASLLGFWPALFVVSFGATSGATSAFLLSRYLFRDAVRSRLNIRFREMLETSETDGGLYLFMLRLTPAVPFFLVNLLMSLTQIKARDFWWISQLGMLPLSIAYVYAGTELPSLKTIAEDGVRSVLSWRLMLAFCLLGLSPVLIKRLATWAFRPAT